MSIIRIVGIGSPFGDDQVGWKVIEHLQQMESLKPYISEQLHLEMCDRPQLRLLDLMRGAHTIFLIEAVHTGAPLGTIQEIPQEAFEHMLKPLSSHGMGIAAVLKLSRIVHDTPEHLKVYGIEIEEVKTTRPIAEAVERAALRLAEQLKEEILCKMPVEVVEEQLA